MFLCTHYTYRVIVVESEYVYITVFLINRNTVLVYVEVPSCLLCYALACKSFPYDLERK